MTRLLLVCALLTGFSVAWLGFAAGGQAQQGWSIWFFDVEYVINQDGTIDVTEQIHVNFADIERHGIFRDMPVEYKYDDDHNRLITVTDVRVDDGETPRPFELIEEGPNLRIKVGDPDILITGQQHYQIHYRLQGALNPFDDHDEFYWNVTGHDWEATIHMSSAVVRLPSSAVQRVECFEGAEGSAHSCGTAENSGDSATFQTTGALPPGTGWTLVVGIEKGAVEVSAPNLVEGEPDFFEEVRDFMGIGPLPIGLSIAFLAIAIGGIGRQWWVAGRDRWYGDNYLAAETLKPRTKPLMARETVVVEYTPPEVSNRREKRRLRPAEIGLLIDERADTLDVSATIVDLAVRKYLRIKETEEGGVFGLFKSRDYELERLEGRDEELLPYEERLRNALFEGGKTVVKLSELKNKFHDDLARVKDRLYKDVTKDLKFFPRSPDTTRNLYLVAGVFAGVLGAIVIYALGELAGAGLLGVPVIGAGLLLIGISPLMPRRTADGRLMYRRALGFRKYIETAEKDRQAFAEKANLFDEYLPYAIVYDCVDKWAKAFEGLEEQAEHYWYRGTRPFSAMAFASNVGSFSSSISGVMASTPGGRGSSGFGGGGFSGGGGGGGGGGSW